MINVSWSQLMNATEDQQRYKPSRIGASAARRPCWPRPAAGPPCGSREVGRGRRVLGGVAVRHSALAALAGGLAGGAAVMAAFSLGSLPALAAAPLMLGRLTAGRARSWSVRAAGLPLVGSSSWALGHGVWERAAAWCAT